MLEAVARSNRKTRASILVLSACLIKGVQQYVVAMMCHRLDLSGFFGRDRDPSYDNALARPSPQCKAVEAPPHQSR
jgi:hypothetical protein